MKTLPYRTSRRPLSTSKLIISLVQSAAMLAAILWATSCAPKAFPVGSPNPLDTPGETEPTAAELHAKNIAAITGNPTKLP